MHQGKVTSDLFSSPISLAVVREFSRTEVYVPKRTYLHTNLVSLKERPPSYYTVRFRISSLGTCTILEVKPDAYRIVQGGMISQSERYEKHN